jgi:hypothetical protein
MTPQEAYSIEKRRSDMRREVQRAFDGGWLHILQFTHLARTFGVSRDDVKAEARKLSELTGGAK